MALLGIIIGSAALLLIAYVTYGRLLARLLRLDDSAVTPAVLMRDGLDYEPIEPKFLLSQHFSAIAAAGPIVGPIVAGVLFGWLPALIWILVGSILMGGVHDFTALVASVRHRAQSIAEVVRENMSRRSFVLFLMFVYIALIYIIVAFTDIVAGSFVGTQTLESGETVTGGGIATSSMLYLALPVIMGLLLRFTRMSLGLATLIFLPLVGVAIWIGQKFPLDVQSIFRCSELHAGRIWGVVLLVYCCAASVLPVWMLLQPRGHLGGYFLYAALAAGVIGIAIGGKEIQYDAFIGWTSTIGPPQPLWPMLFILIACGACSGFHCLIASGTTSKQIRRESDCKVIGYGAMLLEAMVAIISLACVMILTRSQGESLQNKPNLIYAQGIASFLEVTRIPAAVAVSFGLLAFTTFVYDTLDVCTRLGRYIVQELTGLRDWRGRWMGTIVTAALPMGFLFSNPVGPDGKSAPAWRTFWALFGASNQLLAALALIGITVWLWRTYRAWWVWVVTGIPTVFMYAMSTWALLRFVKSGFVGREGNLMMANSAVPWVALVLVGLALMLLVEAARVFAVRSGTPPTKSPVVPSAA